jgi:hypothetical protein
VVGFRLGVGVGWNVIEFIALQRGSSTTRGRRSRWMQVRGHASALGGTASATFTGDFHRLEDGRYQAASGLGPRGPIWVGGDADGHASPSCSEVR